MPFLHPIIFWSGLAAVSVPIIIHLLNRRRYRVRDWAAMKFLLDSIRKNRRRLRIEELILLAIRCLAIFLIGMVLARFVGCSLTDKLNVGKSGSMAIVYILDDSVSMGQKYSIEPAFKLATGDLSKQVEVVTADKMIGILRTSDLTLQAGSKSADNKKDEKDKVFFSLNYLSDKGIRDNLQKRLAELEPSDGVANLQGALDLAGKMLADKPAKKRVVIMGDFRQVDLAPKDAAAAIRRQYAQLREQGIEVVTMDYGQDATTNLTVESFEQVDKVVVARKEARLAISVKNNGVTNASNVKIELKAQIQEGSQLLDVDLGEQKIPDIPAGQPRRLEFSYAFKNAGFAHIRAHVAFERDELPADDTAELAINVLPARKILVIDGDQNVTFPAESESFYLANVLDPQHDKGQGNEVVVQTRDALDELKLTDYDMIFLMNVGSFTDRPDVAAGSKDSPSARQKLEDYVKGGGGLCVFMGNKIDLGFYSRLYNEGKGLMPFPLENRFDEVKNDDGCIRLDAKSIQKDFMLTAFQGEYAVFAGLIRITGYVQVKDVPAPAGNGIAGAPRVLAKFADGKASPAIVQRQFGQGQVVVFYTSGSGKWNDWASETRNPTFPTVMLDMLKAYAHPQPSLTGKVGTPFSFTLPSDAQASKVFLSRPKDAELDKTPLIPEDGVLKYGLTGQAGLYRLELAGSGGHMFFSRFVDPIEGDLRAGKRPALNTAFGAGDFIYQDRSKGQGQADTSQAGKEYWQWIVVALLALLGLEVYLGQKFGHYA